MYKTRSFPDFSAQTLEVRIIYKNCINYNFWHIIFDIRGSLNKFPDFFHMGTFIDSTHMKL